MFEPKWIPTTYERIPYAPNGSTMHDERCSCPVCLPDAPDMLSDEEVARMELQEVWTELQSVPAYVEYWHRQRLCADCGQKRAEVDAYSPNQADAYCSECLDRYAEYERAAKYAEEQAAANELSLMAWIDSHK